MHHQALEHVDFLCSPEAARKTLRCNGVCLLVPREAEENAMACRHCMLSWHRWGWGVMPKTLLTPLMSLACGRSIRLGTHFLHIDALGLPEALLPALSLCADVIREPNITPEHLKSAKLLVNQGRRSLLKMTQANWHAITFVACMPRLSIEVRTGVKMWWKQPTQRCCLKTDSLEWLPRRSWWSPASLIPQVAEHVQSECQRMTWSSRSLEPCFRKRRPIRYKNLSNVPWLRFIWSGLGLPQPCMINTVQHGRCYEFLVRAARVVCSTKFDKNAVCATRSEAVVPSDDFGRFMVFAGTTPDRAAETVQVVEEVMHGILRDRPSEKRSLEPKKGSFRPSRCGEKARRLVPACSAIISPPSERSGIQRRKCSPLLTSTCRNRGGVVGLDLGTPGPWLWGQQTHFLTQ